MASKFDSLESLCELIVDCPHSTPKWTDEGITVLRNQNIRNGVLDLSSPSYTNEEDYQKRIKRAVPQAGDIVFTREAPMGEVCLIPEGLKCCLGQRQVLLRPKKGVSGEYLFWALQSPHVQHQISWNEGTGTTVSNVRIPVLKALQIPRHPADEAEVATHLTNLASKIELNCKTNQTLEQLAQALFKSWFVDFDPVFDNALANGIAVNDFPEALQKKALSRQQQRQQVKQQIANCELDAKPLPEDIQQLFPNEFEQTDEPSIGINGWIPKGWEKSNLKSFGKVVTGKTPPKKIENAFADKGLPFITPSDVDSDVFALTVARYLSSDGVTTVKNNVVEQGSVCVTCIGSQMGKTVIAPYKSVTNQQLNSIVLAKQSYRNYVFMNLRLRREELFNLGSSGSTMPILNKSSFEGLNTLKPTELVLNEFSKVTEKLIDKILLGSHQNEELSKVRDTLLPKLISGELQLPAESIKAEVSA